MLSMRGSELCLKVKIELTLDSNAQISCNIFQNAPFQYMVVLFVHTLALLVSLAVFEQYTDEKAKILAKNKEM
jgi:hypothetical protein